MVVSLSADTKDALAREAPRAAHCSSALLRALSFYGRRGTSFATQRNAVARLARTLVLQEFGGSANAHIVPHYRIELPADLLETPRKPARRCDRTMELRGALLACGSLSAGAQGYHLEFVLAQSDAATRLDGILRSLGFAPKMMLRKRRPVLYFKDFDAIAAVLATIGAHRAVLHLEEIRAVKETKNRIHRLVNTEAANLERSAAAAAAQRQTIDFIASAHGLGNLPRAMREIAELRLRHPDESLAELGRRCKPPISKPTVNSRLCSLGRLAARLRGESIARRRNP